MRTLKGFALLVLGTGIAMAGTVCPASTGANPFPHPPDPSATGCNVVITIAANGSVSTAITDATPYELSEDTLVGVVNNSSTPLTSLSLSGPDIFGFDGDGICLYTFTGNGYCTGSYLTNRWTTPARRQRSWLEPCQHRWTGDRGFQPGRCSRRRDHLFQP